MAVTATEKPGGSDTEFLTPAQELMRSNPGLVREVSACPISVTALDRHCQEDVKP